MKPLILIVEDEPAIVDTIEFVLASEGCQPISVHCGAPVLDMLAQQAIDLILLDVGLPDISGMDLLKAIRQRSQVPVIFLTARSAELDKVVGLELGGDDYVVKPFSPRELAARVKAVLRRTRLLAADAAPTRASAGAVWQLNEEKRQIRYHGQLLELARYEYNLLVVLVKNPGQVFSRDQLMMQAWDEPEASQDRTVDAHIKNLRAKLRAIASDKDPIATHRGIGYALREEG